MEIEFDEAAIGKLPKISAAALAQKATEYANEAFKEHEEADLSRTVYKDAADVKEAFKRGFYKFMSARYSITR